jgi:hypothetical protein
MEETKQPRSMGSDTRHSSSHTNASDDAMTDSILASVRVPDERMARWLDYLPNVVYSRQIARLLTDVNCYEYTCIVTREQLVWINLMGCTATESAANRICEEAPL